MGEYPNNEDRGTGPDHEDTFRAKSPVGLRRAGHRITYSQGEP